MKIFRNLGLVLVLIGAMGVTSHAMIRSINIEDGTIQSVDMADDSIGAAQISANSVGASEWDESSNLTINSGLYSLHETWLDLIAVDSNTFMTDVDIDTTTLAGMTTTYTASGGDFLRQPDGPRRISFIFKGAGTGSTGTIVMSGVNAKGSSVSDTLTFNAANFTSSNTIVSNQALVKITSVTVTYSAFAASDDGSKFFIGISTGIGLAGDLAATSDVYNTVVAGTSEATPTIDATYDVWTPATTEDGSKDYQLWAIIDKSPGQ